MRSARWALPGSMRCGRVKFIEIDLKETDAGDGPRSEVEAMCQKLLANTVIENYSIDIDA